MYHRVFIAILGGLTLLSLTACAEKSADGVTTERSQAVSATIELTTFKSASCGCCKGWLDHARANGFVVTAHDVANLNVVKEQQRIEPRHQSCHTSVSTEGYVFEGHVPAKLIRQFLQSPPAGARGLAVPAMPLGSPGMEVGERFTPYEVLQLNRDGSESVYARIQSAAEQH